MFIFKLIGALLGLKVAKLMGASPLQGFVLGVILGHAFDMIVSTKIERFRARRYWQSRAKAEFNFVFFNSLFSMLGKLCLADGKLTVEELNAVESFMTEGMSLKRKAKAQALNIFHGAAKSSTSFQYDAAQFYEIHQNDPQALESVIGFFFRVAAADGILSESEERLIRSAATLFNLPDSRYEEIRRHFAGDSKRSQRTANGSSSGSSRKANSFEGGIDQHYSTLGCSRSDPEKVIKQRYRKLVSDYHPDKIIGKDLPEDFTKFATEKFKTIQEAYEAVKAERGFQ